MLVYSTLIVDKVGIVDSKLTQIWNNLIRASTIMNGCEPPNSVTTVHSLYTPYTYQANKFDLYFLNTYSDININLRCSSSVANDLGGVLQIIAATTSAMEYVIGRTECLDIESWKFSIGNSVDEHQDVSVDSMASVMGDSRESVIDFLEEYVEPKLDEIEKNCL